MLSLACRDTGAKVIECDYVARGMTEEELWKNGTDHIVKAHGIKLRILLRSLKTIIKDSSNIPKIHTKLGVTSRSFNYWF
jgi:hypothetical protein